MTSHILLDSAQNTHILRPGFCCCRQADSIVEVLLKLLSLAYDKVKFSVVFFFSYNILEQNSCFVHVSSCTVLNWIGASAVTGTDQRICFACVIC